MSVKPEMKLFSYEHLPKPELKAASKLFGDLAREIESTFPEGTEKDVCLRKLLEAKDAGVRAILS